MLNRKTAGEERYDRLAEEAGRLMRDLLEKDVNALSDDDKTALASAGLFGTALRAHCVMKALELGEDRRASAKLKDRFLCAVYPAYAFPDMHDPAVVRASKEDILRDYDAYQAKLEYLRQHGATGEKLAQEAQRFAEELKTAHTLKDDLKVNKPLRIKPSKKLFRSAA